MSNDKHGFIQLFQDNPEITAANGKTIRFREYLESAIQVFDLPPFDFQSAYFLLNGVARGKNGQEIIRRISSFWAEMEETYGN